MRLEHYALLGKFGPGASGFSFAISLPSPSGRHQRGAPKKHVSSETVVRRANNECLHAHLLRVPPKEWSFGLDRAELSQKVVEATGFKSIGPGE